MTRLIAYRSALEVVTQRCAALRVRLEMLEGQPIDARPCARLEKALAWEAELRARLADAMALEGTSIPVARAARGEPVDKVLIAGSVVTVAIAALLVIPDLLRPGRPIEAPPHSRVVVAGNVVSAMHHGDRCTVDVDILRESCRLEVDVVCPTVERRFVAMSCIAPGAPISARAADFQLDGERGHLLFEHGDIDVQLDMRR